MSISRYLTIFLAFIPGLLFAADANYKEDPTYLALRETVYAAFSESDSARFFPAVKMMEEYLQDQDDVHAYYLMRCNEIVFLLNIQKVYEAYKAAHEMSIELRERKLDKEVYLGHGIMGHIYNSCGDFKIAKERLMEAIALLEKEGRMEDLPPFYINIADMEIRTDPTDALHLLEKASEYARVYAPHRTFDIECCKAIAYYNLDDMESFLQIYEYYKEGKASNQSSVYGQSIEMYYQAYQGNVAKAEEIARNSNDPEDKRSLIDIYKKIGRWKDAYEAEQRKQQEKDSINSVILSNSMMGIQNEMDIFEAERKADKTLIISMYIIIFLLLLLIVAFTYITIIRRRHIRQLDKAYQHALQSDKAKTMFIQSMSHEVRTPLNIIMGFTQILADPNTSLGFEDRMNISKMVLKNTHIITTQIDEMLELSINDTSANVENDPNVKIADLLAVAIRENKDYAQDGVQMVIDNQLPKDFAMSTNRHMLRRMINSLLDNACKYTTKGSITLRASIDGNELAIAVEDTGCGIDAKQAERIFERFVKLDNFKSGLGLGLSLCRILATRMKGSVYFDSSYEGPGSRFVIRLPITV